LVAAARKLGELMPGSKRFGRDGTENSAIPEDVMPNDNLPPELQAKIDAALAVKRHLMLYGDFEAIRSKMAPQAPTTLRGEAKAEFMAHSTCAACDFFHPEFTRISAAIGAPVVFHRKNWDWAYLYHHAVRTGAVGPGKRALGFAVGTEPLPSAFAHLGAAVTATDAPEQIGIDQGWTRAHAHTSKLGDLYRPGLIDRAAFDERVAFSVCDMNDIPDDLTGYDFCWSSCSFEHLGTLQLGIDFVIASVEKTLRIGGVACHTTEFNLSSDTETIETAGTVLYRRRDILGLIEALERRGHTVEPFSIAPDTHLLDMVVDTPPYAHNPHLKVNLWGFVSTSVGLVIRRGR
jgi:hypothetical protein